MQDDFEKNCLKLPKKRRFPAVGSRPHPTSSRKFPVTRRRVPWPRRGVAQGLRVSGLDVGAACRPPGGNARWRGRMRAAYTPPLRTHKRRRSPAQQFLVRKHKKTPPAKSRGFLCYDELSSVQVLDGLLNKKEPPVGVLFIMVGHPLLTRALSDSPQDCRLTGCSSPGMAL